LSGNTAKQKFAEASGHQMPSDAVGRRAAEWCFELLEAESAADVLPKLNAWLREDPAHRLAFAKKQRTWRLMRPFFRAAGPGARLKDVQAFFEALDEEIARSPKEFTDS
jgi:ferric-dicitrate binding protein FerR (iron transport regulator)